MGAGQSDLYKGTYGDNPDNIPDELKGKVKLPENDAQLKHIFRDNEETKKQELSMEDLEQVTGGTKLIPLPIIPNLVY